MCRRSPVRKEQQLRRFLTMSSKWFRCVGVVVVASLSLAWATPDQAAHPGDRHQDSYAIYSLLLPGELLRNQDSSQTQRWAIADTTVSATDINPALAPEAALQAPKDHPKWFHDAVNDYNARKNQRMPLMRDFQLDQPYMLLTASEVAEFHSVRTSMNISSAQRQKYSGFPGITYFSEVYFNPSHTGALVYMLDWCGNLCAQAEWIYLEKRGGQWVRRSGKGAR
jgi:hypothetical protein